MNKLMAMSVVALLTVSGMTYSAQAEEKVEIKSKSDGSWKMKVKRKNDKEWEGTYEGRTYQLRGDRFREEGDYTVYGTMAPDNTYIETQRVERYEPSREVVTTRETDVRDGSWDMRVTRRGDDWVGVRGDKTYVLRGDSVRTMKDEGNYTVHGSIGTDGTSITTTKVIRTEAR